MQSNHAIPQNVTQYQFRLVGDMTLKQFLELAGGLLLAYLFYASNLIFIFKYPLALGAAFLGVALAFFPIEDRPLDVWIINFLKAIYGPTRFTWSKSKSVPSIFTYERVIAPTNSSITTKTIKAPTTLKTKDLDVDFSPEELTKLKALSSLMQNQTISHTPVEDKPSVEVRKLGTTVIAPPIIKPKIIPTEKPVEEVKVEPAKEEARLNTISPSQGAPKSSVAATTISLPATPTTPNLITGIVLNKENKLVENAIVQINDSQGSPQRAIRTNALGQFGISTPLENGKYYIEVESNDNAFPTTSIEVVGKILEPIKIQATT